MGMIYSSTPLDARIHLELYKNIYVVREKWFRMNALERHIEICKFILTRRKDLQFSGQSSCAIRNISRIDKYDLRPNCISENRKHYDLICWRYGKRDSRAETIDGLSVASPERTICDLAKYDSPASLLVSINDCLNSKFFKKEDLLNELEAHKNRKWQNRIKGMLDYASDKCDSALETYAWIAIHEAGYKLPMQQVSIYDNRTFIGRVDMLWEIRNRKIVLELDGRIKYSNPDVIFDEKIREDCLREMGYKFIRATWKDVENGILLGKLENAKILKRRYHKKSILDL